MKAFSTALACLLLALFSFVSAVHNHDLTFTFPTVDGGSKNISYTGTSGHCVTLTPGCDVDYLTGNFRFVKKKPDTHLFKYYKWPGCMGLAWDTIQSDHTYDWVPKSVRMG